MPWQLPERAVLGMLGAQPVPGAVKPRLARAIGTEPAAEVASALLLDQLDAWDHWLAPIGRRVLVFSPPDAGPWFDPIVSESLALQPQSEGGLGARIQAFLHGELEDGATRVVLICGDCPTLDPTIVIGAFLCLESNDLVIGPATDGGLYLVGARRPFPPVLENLDCGTPDALLQLIDRLRDVPLSLAVLPPWYTVDTPEALHVLNGHLRAMRRSGLGPDAPRIERVLEAILGQPE